MMGQEQIAAADVHWKHQAALGVRMCCHLQDDVLPCVNRATVQIGGDEGLFTDSCQLHLYEMLSDGINHVFFIV